MKRIFLILSIGVFLFHGVGKYKTFLTTEIYCQAQAEVIPGIDEAIREIFGNLSGFTQKEYIFDKQEVKFFTITKDNYPLGWAVLLDEMGKLKPITFLVAIDKEKKVKEVRVLVYRDMFGDQIRRKSFLRQFQEKSLKNSLQLGQDIDAVTSATISSQAAAYAVRRSLKIIEGLKN